MPTTPPQVATGAKTRFGYRPYQSTSGTTYIYCSTVSKIDPASDSFDKIDATILSSDAKFYARGLPDREGSLTLRRDAGDTAFATIKADLVDDPNKANWDFVVAFSNGDTEEYSGFVSEWKPSSLTVSDVQSVDVTITVLTKSKFTPGPTS